MAMLNGNKPKQRVGKEASESDEAVNNKKKSKKT